MTYNLNVPFRDITGKTVEDQFGNTQMIGEYIAVRLFNAGNADMPQEKILMVYRIARRIIENPAEVQLSHEEVMTVEEQLRGVLTIGAFGQVYDILER